MRRLTSVLDLKYVFPIIEEEDWSIAQVFKVYVQVPEVYIFLSDTEDALILFTPIDPLKYNTHIYTLKSGRGNKLKKFIYEAPRPRLIEGIRL